MLISVGYIMEVIEFSEFQKSLLNVSPLKIIA